MSRSLRQKEQLANGLDLAPVRLLGGFICVDTHLGCSGCRFCLNRRNPLLAKLLDRQVHVDYADVGATPTVLADIIRSLPSFNLARVPLRIGHLTDVRYESADISQLLENLLATHPGYPVVLATRYPVDEQLAGLLQKHPSLLLHLTVTPGLAPDYSRTAPDVAQQVECDSVLASLQQVPLRQRYVMFRPLVQNVEQQVLALMAQLAPGTSFGLHEMSTAGIAGADIFRPMESAAMGLLAEQGRQLGLRFEPWFGCVLRRNLGIPFFRYNEVSASFPAVCQHCPNLNVCQKPEPPSSDAILSAARQLGHEIQRLHQDLGSILLSSSFPAARAEEVFLSELFCKDIRLDSVSRAGKCTQRYLEKSLLSRWERTGFYPVRSLRSISGKMSETIEKLSC